MISIKEMLVNKNYALYLDSEFKWLDLKKYGFNMTSNWCGPNWYKLSNSTYWGSSAEHQVPSCCMDNITPIKWDDIIEYRNTLSLEEVNSINAIIYLDNEEIHDMVRKVFPLCNYYGKHCYSLKGKNFSSSSSEISDGAYSNSTYVKIRIDQIEHLLTKNVVLENFLIEN